MGNRLKEKVAIITGGSSGIGLAVAQKFVEEGAIVISADIAAPKDSKIDFIQTDVTDGSSLRSLVEKVVEKYKHIDILVANAGVAEKKNAVSQLDEDNWNKVISIDLTGVVLSNKYVVQQMEKQNSSSSVINMSSILGVVGGEKSQAYSAAKAGVANYTKSQAITYATQGIRFNSVAPGYEYTFIENST